MAPVPGGFDATLLGLILPFPLTKPFLDNYYLSFPKDPMHMKVLVYFSFAIEVAQTMMVTRDTYKVFAGGFGDLTELDNLHLLWLTLPILGGIVGLLCHLMFAYRITLLSDSTAVGCVIVALSLCASVSAFVFGGKLLSAGVLSKAVMVKHIYLTCGIWNGAGALCDVLIAGCMFYYLSRNQTGFQNTDILITRIVRLSIETGIITTTASITSAILFVGFRDQLTTSVYFVIPAIMITKLYSITILATFNNRPHAVGGPPPLPEAENSFDNKRTFSRTFDRKEIRIGRSVVRQVWTDGAPVEHIEMYGEETHSIKDDAESSKRAPDILTTPEEGPP
ncbi:hypothetical protein NLJ89_g2223 [Agrocybe chaxingu]|uniref:DUF6534 domain-containing protein n=1 Tax=Agrocybe chaxingu TaxID=84603 RepID=A0A9W8MYX4_9AGAR|nr:hypothetical protein NLJ89_g2223 [Agrocybe chaxingu]